MRRTIVAALMMFSPLCLASSASAGAMTYLSLGDSVAFGETDFTHNPSGGNRGFVKLYDQYLGQKYGANPNVVNLAIDGETSASLLGGTGRVAYAPGVTDSQLALLNTHYATEPNVSQNVRFIQAVGHQLAAGNTLSDVTISLGANDLFKLAATPGFQSATPQQQQQMLAQAMGTLAMNYSTLLSEVRGLLPNAHIVLVGEYNPLNGVPAAAIQALNATIQGLAKSYNASYADTYTPFVGHESSLTLANTVPGNVLPNAKGYAVIAGAVEGVPEPSTLAALGLGCAGLAVHARRRRALASA